MLAAAVAAAADFAPPRFRWRQRRLIAVRRLFPFPPFFFLEQWHATLFIWRVDQLAWFRNKRKSIDESKTRFRRRTVGIGIMIIIIVVIIIIIF